MKFPNFGSVPHEASGFTSNLFYFYFFHNFYLWSLFVMIWAIVSPCFLNGLRYLME